MNAAGVMRPCRQADGLTSQLSAGTEDGREQAGTSWNSCGELFPRGKPVQRGRQDALVGVQGRIRVAHETSG